LTGHLFQIRIRSQEPQGAKRVPAALTPPVAEANLWVALDGHGFVLLLAFVMANSVVMLRRGDPAPGKTPHSTSPPA